jgi:hypothetical protein
MRRFQCAFPVLGVGDDAFKAERIALAEVKKRLGDLASDVYINGSIPNGYGGYWVIATIKAHVSKPILESALGFAVRELFESVYGGPEVRGAVASKPSA